MPDPPVPVRPGPMSGGKMQAIRESGYQQPGARATGRQVAAGGSQVGQPTTLSPSSCRIAALADHRRHWSALSD